MQKVIINSWIWMWAVSMLVVLIESNSLRNTSSIALVLWTTIQWESRWRMSSDSYHGDKLSTVSSVAFSVYALNSFQNSIILARNDKLWIMETLQEVVITRFYDYFGCFALAYIWPSASPYHSMRIDSVEKFNIWNLWAGTLLTKTATKNANKQNT